MIIDQKKKIENEITILQKMRHENVIRFYERLPAPSHDLIFMEACQGGDLLKYVRRRVKLDEDLAKYMFR